MLQESNEAGQVVIEHLGAPQPTVVDLIVRQCFSFKADSITAQALPDVIDDYPPPCGLVASTRGSIRRLSSVGCSGIQMDPKHSCILATVTPLYTPL
jgi:hypothetical protein